MIQSVVARHLRLRLHVGADGDDRRHERVRHRRDRDRRDRLRRRHRAHLVDGGSGYVTPGGIKKFVDTLPGLTEAGANNLGQYIPLAQPDTTTFANADYYVIAVVQHRERMSSSLPAQGTLLREYVQLSTAAIPASTSRSQNDMPDGTTTPALMPDGSQAYGVDDPHYLGPTIVATKDRAVRIVFYNLLPKGADGDLFLPTDTTHHGLRDEPDGRMAPTRSTTARSPTQSATRCAPRSTRPDDARHVLHREPRHAAPARRVTPWISDGTPHQWITPANETTPWPQGVSVQNVPDMVGAASRPACRTARPPTTAARPSTTPTSSRRG